MRAHIENHGSDLTNPHPTCLGNHLTVAPVRFVCRRNEFNSEVHAARLGDLPPEATALHLMRQVLGWHPPLTAALGVGLVVLEERARLHLCERARLAVLLDEAAEGVGLLAVGAYGVRDERRWAQALALPLEAAFDRPLQDAGELRGELPQQVAVLLVLRNSHREGHQVQTAPDSLIGTVDGGLVVAADDDAVGGPEVEE